MNFRSLVVAALATLALLACGDPANEAAASAASTTEAAPARGTSPLEAAFDSAATEYQVPEELLKAIAWVETRVRHPGPKASMTGGFGPMNLVERTDWNALERGAAITGADQGRVKLDEAANIRAAAAFLRELADKSFADYAHLNPTNVADWWHAVSLYAGATSATVGADYAAEIFQTIDRGFEETREDGTVVLRATHHDWEKHAPIAQRRDGVKEYPGAYQWVASPNYSNGRSSYTYVLIHTVQGSYSGCISWFKNPASNVSAQYVVRSSDGQITQMVEHGDTAWHAQCYNGKSIGIEHEGYVNAPSTWYTAAMYNESAKLTRWIADRHGIPKTRSRIIGHYEVAASCNTGGHSDPGTGWNWTKYMGLVLGSTPTGTTGVLKGVIYKNGNTADRVSGAVVTVNGQSVTTGTTGEYTFTLAGGTYTATVTKTGYTSKSITKTVTAGATVWGSMEINPTATTGTLTGAIYQAGSTTNRVSGAVVTVNGQSVTTLADGLYKFNLAPGTYTATVTKTGYSTNSVQRTVVASTTVWGSMEINPVANPGTIKGVIYQNGNTADRVAGVTVKVTGTAQQMVTVADGVYTFNLAPGTYTMTAEKSGYQTSSITKTVSSGTTVWGSMELKTGVPVADTTPPAIGITFPGDGASMDVAELSLLGDASDDKGAIDQITLTINGGTPAKVNVSGGKFAQAIKLSPGLNTIEVVATDAAGNSATDTVKATFRSGVFGFVHLADDEAARVPDVTLRLVDSMSGAEIASTVSGADGSYAFDLAQVPGDFLFMAKASGFLSKTETISVPDDERFAHNLAMVEGQDPLPSELAIEFIDPVDGATVNTDSVTIYGSVGGFDVQSVVVKGVNADLIGAGGFAATVPLDVGPNVIDAVATGLGGESLTGQLTIIRQGGDAPPAGEDPANTKAGCTAVPGLELVALLAVVPLLRRRNQAKR